MCKKRVKTLAALTTWVDQEALVVGDQYILREIQQVKLRLKSQETMYLLNSAFNDLPFVRNPAFYARQTELHQLVKYLRPGEISEGLLIAGLHGIGGTGKTQIALEYAYRNKNRYDAILWVAAETAVKLARSYTDLGRGLGIFEGSIQNTDQACDLLKRWLANTSQRSKL